MNSTTFVDQWHSQPDLLNRDQEVDLCERVEAGLYAQWLLERESPQYCTDDLVRVVTDGNRAWNRLWLSNIGLVKTLAWRYSRRQKELMDELVQEGQVALAEALMRYDHRRGARISTHAWRWVRGHFATLVTAEMEHARRLVAEDFVGEHTHPVAPEPADQDEELAIGPLLAGLSRQERQLLVMLANGWTQQRTAIRLGMSQTSVRRIRDRAVNCVRAELGLPALVAESAAALTTGWEELGRRVA